MRRSEFEGRLPASLMAVRRGSASEIFLRRAVRHLCLQCPHPARTIAPISYPNPMAQTEWIVFTCRACRGLIKLSPGLAAAGSVICPRCRTKVSVPKDASRIQEDGESGSLPPARNVEPANTTLRGPRREEWEVGNRPIGGDLEFRERLHQTTEPEFKHDPSRPTMARVNTRRRKYERTHSDFDSMPEAAADQEDEAAGEGSHGSGGRRSRRRGSRRHYQNRGKEFADTFNRMLIGAVVILAAVAGWLLWDRLKKKDSGPPPRSYAQIKMELPQDADGPKLEQRSMTEFGPRLAAVVRQFVSAPTVEELLPLVRDRQRVEPLLRAHYTPEHPWTPFEIRNTFEASERAGIEGNFIHLELSKLNFETVDIVLERTGESFLVDWESFTGHGELTWDAFIKTRPEKPVLMRVQIEKSRAAEYYNEDFTDKTKWNCVLLRDTSGTHLLSGYTARESPADTALKQRLYIPGVQDSIRRATAVLKLRFAPGGKSARQVEITEFVEHGWVFRPDNDIPAPAPR
jgi:hypothetical protein